ncbi:MAG TPA: DUF4136 domain-containing protein [Candidatus Alistipes intestinipullorum]|nr:DUF4136 domain-containing protein [Candidatus Alistipes intestinipullorum]
MKIKNLRYFAYALLAVAFSSCQKEPSTSELNDDYLVYTDYDTAVDFSAFETYFIPDSILLIGSNYEAEYWKDEDAQEIISTVITRMNSAGYTQTDDKATANLGIQLSYVKKVTYFVGYNNPYWWWYYPYYWAPGYWGDWLGWHYPYSVYYGYTAGSLLMEMVNLEAEQEGNKKLPVIWDGFIGGLLTSDSQVNLERTIAGVDQAFEQTPVW